MRCPSCGTENPVARATCSRCGAPSDAVTISPASSFATYNLTERPQTEASNGPTFTAVPFAGPEPHAPLSRRRALTAGEVFGSRYVIRRLLGEGGMGAVYEAVDRELNVTVALKVIRPEITADAKAADALERRFKRELLLARQVTHENVVRIHDLGEVGGVKYISMSYVDGVDLASMLSGSHVLPVAQALRIARSVASGLQAAHKAGVIHRDLKPANVMISSGGEALIMDFGIARSAVSDSDMRTTVVPDGTPRDVIVGTIPYMAPEQLVGGADERTDVYSFGLLIYDTLTATRRAAYRKDAYAELLARAKNPPPSVRTVVPEVPDALERIISRCLQPTPEARYASASELITDLDRLDDEGHPLPIVRRLTRRLVLTSAAAVCAMLAATWWAAQSSAPPAPPPPMSALIADFDNRTGEDLFTGVLEEAVGVGIEEASFINLFPRVEAQRLVFQIADADRLDLERARIVAQREGVKVVLAGSITRNGSQYRVAMQVVDPIPGTVLSTVETTASSAEDVLRSAGELASELRAALGDTQPESGSSIERETFTAASLQAASAYTRGQELLNNSKYDESIEWFQRATKLDAGFARAYANWAVASFAMGRRSEAETLYKRAFALSDRMTEREKYRTYGTYYLTVAQAYDDAIANYSKLLELYPSDRVAHGNLAVAYFYVLDFAKAMEHGRRAAALYPSTKLRNNLALYAMYASDFATAADDAQEVIQRDPRYTRAYVPIAIAALDDNRPAAARSAYEKMATTGADGASRGAMGLADLALYEGRYADVAAVLERAIAADEKTANHAGAAAKYIALAEAHAATARPQQALAAVRQALEASPHESVQFSAGRLLIQLGREAEARQIADALGQKVDRHSRAYARILTGEIALGRGEIPVAIDALREGQKLADFWLGQYVLGQAYLAARQYPQALAAFEACLKRRGEATAIFLDDVPSFRNLAQLRYWLGKAREGVGQAQQAAAEYRRFLALRGGVDDPLVQDARRQLASLTGQDARVKTEG